MNDDTEQPSPPLKRRRIIRHVLLLDGGRGVCVDSASPEGEGESSNHIQNEQQLRNSSKLGALQSATLPPPNNNVGGQSSSTSSDGCQTRITNAPKMSNSSMPDSNSCVEESLRRIETQARAVISKEDHTAGDVGMAQFYQVNDPSQHQRRIILNKFEDYRTHILKVLNQHSSQANFFSFHGRESLQTIKKELQASTGERFSIIVLFAALSKMVTDGELVQYMSTYALGPKLLVKDHQHQHHVPKNLLQNQPQMHQQTIQQQPKRQLQTLYFQYDTASLGLSLQFVNNNSIKVIDIRANATLVKQGDCIVGINGERFHPPIQDTTSYYAAMNLLKTTKRPMLVMFERLVDVPPAGSVCHSKSPMLTAARHSLRATTDGAQVHSTALPHHDAASFQQTSQHGLSTDETHRRLCALIPPQSTYFQNPAPPHTPQHKQTYPNEMNDNTVKEEIIRHNLNPAQIPFIINLNDVWQDSTHLEKELAWLSEESAMITPQFPSAKIHPDNDEKKMAIPLVLDFAWRHGSLALREQLLGAFPTYTELISALMNTKASGNNATESPGDAKFMLIDAINLFNLHHCNPNIIKLAHLRKEARNAIRALGYRRSEAIERELNAVHTHRFRNAVEELGDNPSVGNGNSIPYYLPAKMEQPRQKRKRIRNADLLIKAALEQDQRGQSGQSKRTKKSVAVTKDIERIAINIPSELTTEEDEVAWLAEESLILLPDNMLKGASASDPNKKITSITSAGLVTKSREVNWDYVVNNASDSLKEELKRIGGIKRRPLQRIIRLHNTEVKCAFTSRRDDVASLLILHGYRRKETINSLPSHELLQTTGMHDILAVKLMRRRRETAKSDVASQEDLRSACNARLGDKEKQSRKKSLKRPKEKKKRSTPKTVASPRKKAKQKSPKRHVPQFSLTQKATSLILTAVEEEIAWLREEYEGETGVKAYNWEYIEQNCSLPMLITLAEKKCDSSGFPSVPGVSKLRIMVRLHIPSVKEAYARKRVDIRYTIQKSFIRDRGKNLPEIQPAPPSFEPPLIRKNGSAVLDLEYAYGNEDSDCDVDEEEVVDLTSKIAASSRERNDSGLVDSATLIKKEYVGGPSLTKSPPEEHTSEDIFSSDRRQEQLRSDLPRNPNNHKNDSVLLLTSRSTPTAGTSPSSAPRAGINTAASFEAKKVMSKHSPKAFNGHVDIAKKAAELAKSIHGSSSVPNYASGEQCTSTPFDTSVAGCTNSPEHPVPVPTGQMQPLQQEQSKETSCSTPPPTQTDHSLNALLGDGGREEEELNLDFLDELSDTTSVNGFSLAPLSNRADGLNEEVKEGRPTEEDTSLASEPDGESKDEIAQEKVYDDYEEICHNNNCAAVL